MSPRITRWSELIPGLIMSAVVIATTAAILVFARLGALHGETVLRQTSTGSARGVIVGTDVWIAGQPVGKVKAVRFRPFTVDSARRVVIELEILSQFAHLLRQDSQGQIRAGGNLIGAQVIYIFPGTGGSPELSARDTMELLAQGDTEGVTSQVALASREFGPIVANLKTISGQLESKGGTAGAVISDVAFKQQMQVFGARSSGLMQRVSAGKGTVALAMRGGDLTVRARSAMSQADSVRQLLATPGTSLGRFRRDSTLLKAVGEVRNEVSIVRALMDEPRGTAGRAIKDSAVVLEIRSAEKELGALIADIRRNPLRYVAF